MPGSGLWQKGRGGAAAVEQRTQPLRLAQTSSIPAAYMVKGGGRGVDRLMSLPGYRARQRIGGLTGKLNACEWCITTAARPTPRLGRGIHDRECRPSAYAACTRAAGPMW